MAMRTVGQAALLVFLLSAVVVHGGGDDEEVEDDLPLSGPSDVVILTTDNFDDLTAQGSWLIEFFAPWCGHCKKLKPVWEQAATKLQGKMNLATVDCTSEKALQDRFEVKSFPTLKFWRAGVARVYKGNRSVEAFYKFGVDMNKPAVEEVADAKSVKEASASSVVSFLFVGAESSSAAGKVFQQVAFQLQPVHKFMRAKGEKLTKKYEVSSASVVALMEGGDDEKFTGPWTETALTNWIEARKLPLLSELDAQNFEDVTQGGKIVIFSVTDPYAGNTRAFLKQMLSVARRYREFIFANIDGVQFSKYVAQFSITPEQLPALFALNYPKDEYYLSEESGQRQHEQYIAQFADGILSGTIPARATSAWYSPMRYYKMFEKWLGSFSESQLAIGVVFAMVLFIIIIGAGCYYGAADFGPDPPKAGAAAVATTGDGKKDK